MKVVVIGRTEWLHATTLHLVEQTGHQVVGVITARSSAEARKKESDFAELAKSCGAFFCQTQTIDDGAKHLIREAGAEIAVSVNWVSLLGQEIIDLFPHGILNAHLGDLPRYRGNAAANWAIVNGEKEIGLTVHLMEPGELDSGPILLKEKIPLSDETTIADVTVGALERLPGMFAEAVDGIESGRLEPTAQSTTGLEPFRCYPRLPRDGKIDWAASAKTIHALVRSLARPYPGAYTYYRDSQDRLQKLSLWRTRVVAETTADVGVPGQVIRNDKTTGESQVLCGGGILGLLECRHGGDEPFEPGREWRSIRMRLGMDIDDELYRLRTP